jgi:hypothetical protein
MNEPEIERGVILLFPGPGPGCPCNWLALASTRLFDTAPLVRVFGVLVAPLTYGPLCGYTLLDRL